MAHLSTADGASRSTVVAIAAALKDENVNFDLGKFCMAAGQPAYVNCSQDVYVEGSAAWKAAQS